MALRSLSDANNLRVSFSTKNGAGDTCSREQTDRPTNAQIFRQTFNKQTTPDEQSCCSTTFYGGEWEATDSSHAAPGLQQQPAAEFHLLRSAHKRFRFWFNTKKKFILSLSLSLDCFWRVWFLSRFVSNYDTRDSNQLPSSFRHLFLKLTALEQREAHLRNAVTFFRLSRLWLNYLNEI